MADLNGAEAAIRAVSAEGETREVAFSRWGTETGRTPVLLLHGVTDAGVVWGPIAQLRSDDRVLVAVDARGHGRTPLGDGEFTVAALAADAAAVLQEVIGRPAVVVGHSMGGIVAVELALTYPELVVGLVLEEPALGVVPVGPPGPAPDFLVSWATLFAGVPAEALEQWARRNDPSWPEDEYAVWARSKTQFDQRTLGVPHQWSGRDWVEALAEVRCPMTIIVGEPARGSVIDSAAAARMLELPGDRVTHIRVPGVGHNVRRDDRAAFLAALDSALAVADAAQREAS